MVEFHVDAMMIPLTKLEPSKLNPNEMADERKNLLKAEILKIGFTYPLIVRSIKKKDGYYQILDGEQRWTVAHDPELDIVELPCIVLDGITDDEAKYLLYTINNLKGKVNPVKLGILIQNLRRRKTSEDIFKRTGLKIHQQECLLERLNPQFADPGMESTIKKGQHKTLIAVLNHEEYETVMTAIRKTKASGTESALLEICKHFIDCKEVKIKLKD